MQEPRATAPRAGSGASDGSYARKGWREAPTIYAKGLLMGCGDLVPGVGGGTVAIILGVYFRLLDSLGVLSKREFLGALFRGRVAAAYRAVDGAFLLPLVAGIGTALFALARVVSAVLERYPHEVLAFFFGLVAASAIVTARPVRRWRPWLLLLLALGAAIGFGMVRLTPVATPSSPLFLGLAGFLAICAMVLPGISGTLVLVLLGKYDVAVAALGTLDLGVLVPLSVGALLGLLSFASLLVYLIKRYHDPMLALLSGFIVGSLDKVWPFADAAGNKAWPWATGDLGSVLVTVLLAAASFALVLVLDGLSAARERARAAAPPS